MPGARRLPPLIEAFLDMIAAERGASKNTSDAYARDLSDYASGLARAGKTPQTASTSDIRAYLSSLAERGLKPASSARKLSSIRQFHRFLVTDGRRADDPALIIEAPRRGRNLPKTLSIAEVGHLLAVSKEGLDDEERPRAERLRALRMACLLLPTSLRHGFTGVGAGGAARRRGANKGPLSPYSRQGRARTAGAAFRCGATSHCGRVKPLVEHRCGPELLSRHEAIEGEDGPGWLLRGNGPKRIMKGPIILALRIVTRICARGNRVKGLGATVHQEPRQPAQSS